MTMQLVVTGEKPRLIPVRQDVAESKRVLSVGKINLWRHHVKLAHQQPAGMFTLINSQRP